MLIDFIFWVCGRNGLLLGDALLIGITVEHMVLFQNKFDELWRRFQTYSAGEDLFGLPVTDYPSLMRIRKELNLLQKLYGLYNSVMISINGYFDIVWVEVDIEKINNELLDFQNRYPKS